MTNPVQKIFYSSNGNITNKYNSGTYAYDATKVHAVTSVTKTAGTTPQTLQNIAYTKFNKAETITQRTPVTNKLLTYALTYGPDEQRVKTVYTDTLGVPTTIFYAGSYEKEIKGSTTRQIHYIIGGTGLVAVYIKKNTDSGNLYYVCTDRQGSIAALLNPNGTVAEKYSYDAWGRRRNPNNWNDYNVPAPTLINRGYTGHEMLDGFGLINMNGRMYDPVIGRVLSPDKVVQAPGYTQSYNRYSYCMNNSLRYTDPSGYNEHPADWGMEPYFPLAGYDIPWMSGACGPGNGHWSDQLRSVYGNFMTMSSTSFQDYYGISSIDYNSNIVPNYKDLPHFSHDFKTNSRGEFGFFVQYDAGVAINDGKSNNGAVDIDGANIGGRFVIIRDTKSSGYSNFNIYRGTDNLFNSTSAIIDAFSIATLKMLTNEYKAGADVVEIAQSVKAVSRLGKISIAINISSIGYDVVSGNVRTSTITDAAMIGVGVVVGIAIGPITAGVVGLVYGGVMLFGGQDAINNAFDGNWNLQINKSIQGIY